MMVMPASHSSASAPLSESPGSQCWGPHGDEGPFDGHLLVLEYDRSWLLVSGHLPGGMEWACPVVKLFSIISWHFQGGSGGICSSLTIRGKPWGGPPPVCLA